MAEFDRRRFVKVGFASLFGAGLALVSSNEADAYRGPHVWPEYCTYNRLNNQTLFDLHTRFEKKPDWAAARLGFGNYNDLYTPMRLVDSSDPLHYYTTLATAGNKRILSVTLIWEELPLYAYPVSYYNIINIRRSWYFTLNMQSCGKA